MLRQLLHGLRPPKLMPEPDPRCRTYDFAEAVLLFRNHDDAVRKSKELHREEKDK